MAAKVKEKPLSSNYGANIQLSADHRCAKRCTSSYNKGLVFTSQPIPRDKVLQFTVERDKRSEWDGSLKVGVTGIPPERACGVETATDLRHATLVLCTSSQGKKRRDFCQDVEMSSTHIYINGKRVLQLDATKVDLSTLNTREEVGVTLRKNALHFFLAGHTHLRVELSDVLELPGQRYGLVDVYGSCTSISNTRITSYKDLQKSVAWKSIDVSISEQMVRECGIVQKQEETASPRVTASTIPQECRTSLDMRCLQEQLLNQDREGLEGGRGMREGGREMREGGRGGIREVVMLEEGRGVVMESGRELMMEDRRGVLIERNPRETASEHTGSSFEDLSLQEYDIPSYDDKDDDFLGSSQEGQYGVEGWGQGGVAPVEGAEGIKHGGTAFWEEGDSSWAGSHHRQEVEEEVGGREPALEEVWPHHRQEEEVGRERSPHPPSLAREDYNVVTEINNESIKVDVNKRVQLDVNTAAFTKKTLIKNVKKSDCTCRYSKLVHRYAATHDFSKKLEGYVDSRYDKCYCSSCSRGDEEVKPQGRPPQLYSVPRGWFKLGLKLQYETQARKHESFKKWHKAYHGTPLSNVEKILDTGGIIATGSRSFGGQRVTPGVGHYTEENKPPGHDLNRVFLSPSIVYASRQVFTRPHRYVDQEDNVTYEVRLCFKVLVDPSCYTVSPQTILPPTTTQPIDELFDNRQLEWATDNDRMVYIYALMIRMDPLQHQQHTSQR